MKATAKEGDRVDWQAARESIDLAAVATRYLGPAPGRRGERGRKLWWPCPYHHDANPSFCVDPGREWFRCYGCDAKGDAATLVMHLDGLSFPEAVRALTGGRAPSGKARPTAAASPKAESQSGPEGMAEAEAIALIEQAEERLWAADGAEALTYLRGRGLADATIRAARLGVVRQGLDLPGQPTGVVIPWMAGGVPTLVKLRQPEGRRPKYREVYRHRALHAGIYPGREAVRSGRPLVIVEGEFDALLVGQELDDLAGTITLGGASSPSGPGILGALLAASPWYLAQDADEAGEKAASSWPQSARRVRPPGPFKDWGEVREGGIGLRRWWAEVIRGIETPSLFSWEELATWRWGPSGGDPEPGITVDRPDPAAMLAALEAGLGRADPYAAEERAAIQSE